MTFKEVVKISRPRFWIYALGPFLVGYIAGNTELLFWKNIDFLNFFIFFLLPANILIYGINDLSDEDTDQYNKRKGEEGYEVRVRRSERIKLAVWVVLSAGIGVLLTLGNLNLLVSMLFFIFLSVAYSAPPIRFKARPFFDAYSNFLYVVPGIIGYILTAGMYPSWVWLLVGLLWVAGMHTFSAIPDIDADKKAGITTTAVKLGKKNSLIFVGINWLIFSLLLIFLEGAFMAVTLIYPLITLYLYTKEYEKVAHFYNYFPILNGLLGLFAFWYILLSKFSINEVWQNVPF